MTSYVHLEIKILSLFTFPHFVPNLYGYFFCETESQKLFANVIKVNGVKKQHWIPLSFIVWTKFPNVFFL